MHDNENVEVIEEIEEINEGACFFPNPSRTRRQDDLTIEIMFPSGAIKISAIIDQQLVTRRYFDYSEDEAIEFFQNEFPQLTP